MIKNYTLICVLALLLSPLAGQTHKTIHLITPGTLSANLTELEKSAVTHLTVTGIIDSLDYITMNQEIPHLAVLDLSGCTTASHAVCSNAFFEKFSLETILLPPDVKRIGREAFLACEFKSITLPPALEVIESSAFAYCNIKTIILPASLKIIEYSAFSLCDSLTRIDVEAGNDFFCDVDGVLFNHDISKILIYPQAKKGAYHIPATVTEIYNGAFSNNHFLDSLYIPPLLHAIGRHGLFRGSALVHIQVDENNMHFCDVAGVLFSKDTTVLVRYPPKRQEPHYKIPERVTRLGEICFHYCKSLLTVSLPYNLTHIGEYAFGECYNLTSLELPPAVDTIGIRAFMYCRAMEKIRIPSSVLYFGKYFLSVADQMDTLMVNAMVPYILPHINNFDMVDTTKCILYVPEGSAEAYRNAFGWKSFVNIVEYEISFEVSQTQFTANSTGSLLTFNITSNTDWKIHASEPWVTLSDSVGAYNKTITITVDANNTSMERQAYIMVHAAGQLESELMISQTGLAVTTSQIENDPVSLYFISVNKSLVITGSANRSCMVYSIDGKICRSMDITGDREIIPLNGLPAGLYIAKTGLKTLKIIL